MGEGGAGNDCDGGGVGSGYGAASGWTSGSDCFSTISASHK